MQMGQKCKNPSGTCNFSKTATSHGFFTFSSHLQQYLLWTYIYIFGISVPRRWWWANEKAKIKKKNIGLFCVLGHFKHFIYMGQKLQDGKKVLWMSQNSPHSLSCPGQTVCAINLPFWILGKLIEAHLHLHFPLSGTIFKGWKVFLKFWQ